MRHSGILLVFLSIGVFLALAPPIPAQTEPQTQKQSERPATPEEERIIKVLQKYAALSQVGPPDDPQIIGNVDGICDELAGACEMAAKLKSARIVQAIVDFPVHDPHVGKTKMLALTPFKDNAAAHACVVEGLQNPEPQIQKHAAQVLFRWGEWDLAIPVIHKYGYYEGLEVDMNNLDARVIPILQEGARSSDWEGRTLAAYYLQYFGDSTTIVEVARDVVAHAPNVDDHSIARAKYTALRTLARYHVTDMVSGIARLADDQSALVRIQVVDILELYAFNGIEEARQALERIAAENADLNLRENAKAALDNMERNRGGK